MTRTYVAPGSDTSREAAIRAQRFAGPQALDIWRWLQQRGPMGGSQLEASVTLGISRQSCCGRFKALEDAGFIRKTQARRQFCAVYLVCGDAPTQLELL